MLLAFEFCGEGVCNSPFLEYVSTPLSSSLLYRGAGSLAQQAGLLVKGPFCDGAGPSDSCELCSWARA